MKKKIPVHLTKLRFDVMPLLKHTGMPPPGSWTPNKKSSVFCDSVPCCFHNPPPLKLNSERTWKFLGLIQSFFEFFTILEGKTRPIHSSYLPWHWPCKRWKLLELGNHFIALGHSRSAGAEAAPVEWVASFLSGHLGLSGRGLTAETKLKGGPSTSRINRDTVDSKPASLRNIFRPNLRSNRFATSVEKYELTWTSSSHFDVPTPQPPLFRDDHHHCSFIRPYFHEISLKRPTGCSSSKQTRCFSLTETAPKSIPTRWLRKASLPSENVVVHPIRLGPHGIGDLPWWLSMVERSKIGVSKNRGTPKWMIWGYPYFWKHPNQPNNYPSIPSWKWKLGPSNIRPTRIIS